MGNAIEVRLIDPAGKLALNEFKVAGARSKFDERGNLIENAYFGIDDKPILGKDGYAGWRSKFDERGNEIEMSVKDSG